MRSALGLLGGITAGAVLVVVSVFVLGVAGGLARESAALPAPPATVAAPFRECLTPPMVAARNEQLLDGTPAVTIALVDAAGQLVMVTWPLGARAAIAFTFGVNGCLRAVAPVPPPL